MTPATVSRRTDCLCSPVSIADAIHVRGWLIRATCPACDIEDIYIVGDSLAALHALRCACGEVIYITPRRPSLLCGEGV